jgi:signal transduction histidine kinase
VLAVEVCGLTLSISLGRRIASGLRALILSAKKMATGDFSFRAKVKSEDEIGTLAMSFNEMAAQLEQTISALKQSKEQLKISKNQAEQSALIKENFLANMSHEIRTPMNAVIGFTNLLEHTTLDEHQRKFVEAIRLSGENLLTIINDILDYSKIESGMITFEQIPFSVTNVFESLKVLVQSKADSKKLQLSFTVDGRIPSTLLGDPTRLVQVLLNLTDNAIKFTGRGTVDIVATLSSEENDTATVEFSVKDTGKGIPKEKFNLIFDRFTQASPETTRQFGGTGLGLSIAKSLVEQQKGHISLVSELEKGTKFTFVIPYHKTEEVQKPVAEKSKQIPGINREQPLQVLLAEDNKMNQSLVKYVLGKYSMETDVVENGKLAIARLQEKQYDIVLMDIQMPVMDGYEATRLIRNEFKNNIPIIALTAHAMNEERDKCLALGMNDYISKPFDPNLLYQKIISACAVEG